MNLGVLAIIGVLSVGAIAGYSKAMMKYKLNKQTEQIGSILDNALIHAEEFSRSKKDLDSGAFFTVLKSLNIIPQEMIRPNTTTIRDVFNNAIRIGVNFESSGNYLGLSIDVGDNPQVCLNLLQMAKLRSAFLWQIVFTKITDDDTSTQFSNRVFGDDYCTTNCLKNLSIAKSTELCETCQKTKNCTLSILWNYSATAN